MWRDRTQDKFLLDDSFMSAFCKILMSIKSFSLVYCYLFHWDSLAPSFSLFPHYYQRRELKWEIKTFFRWWRWKSFWSVLVLFKTMKNIFYLGAFENRQEENFEKIGRYVGVWKFVMKNVDKTNKLHCRRHCAKFWKLLYVKWFCRRFHQS